MKHRLIMCMTLLLSIGICSCGDDITSQNQENSSSSLSTDLSSTVSSSENPSSESISSSEVISSSSAMILSSSSALYWNVAIGYGQLEDSRDGKVYRTIKVAGIEWMGENLNFKTSNSACQDDDTLNCYQYGSLYNWEEAIASCPTGWTLPSTQNWSDLVNSFNVPDSAGIYLKARSDLWRNDNNGTDLVGFAALPGGSWSVINYETYGDGYSNLRKRAQWWTSTENGINYANNVVIERYKAAVLFSGYDRSTKYSVRCIKSN